MNTKQKLLSLTGTIIVAALLAGSAVSAVMAACGLGPCTMQAYAAALAAAVFCALTAFSPRTAIPTAIIAIAGVGAYVALNISGGSISELIGAIRQLRAGGERSLIAPSAPLIAAAGSALMSLITYVLISDRSIFTTVVAVVLTLGITIVSCAAGNVTGLSILMPAMLGTCLAISHTAEHRASGGHLKAIIPAVIAVLIAALLLPAAGTTFGPFEDAANYVRQLYEDYFSYTHERVAFSIAEKGYDYYFLFNDEPTHMLGGPADPSTEAVMRVTTDDDILLRGTARGTYTGYSWVDDTAKTRNLYYDFTRRSRRSSTFGADLIDDMDDPSIGFRTVEAEVTMLGEGSSTLFIPARLTGFDMDLKNAVYYNSAGEMFLTRNVEKGDTYTMTALEPIDSAAIIALEAESDPASDKGYEAAMRDYLQLPDCIEDGVYQVADALTEGASTDAEKADAILNGLVAGCSYRLDVDYPPQDRDFVSYFLLESREGYCSYFASAMVVLCRAEGIPARYVEGYRVYAEPDGVTNITGEDAHAWVEVYIRGVGWVAYDPTPGNEPGGESEDHQGEQNGTEPTPSPTPSPTPEPTPEPTPDPDTGLPPEETPTPEPGVDDEPTPEPSSEPSDEPSAKPTEEPDDTPEPPAADNSDKSGKWKWLILAALILMLIIVIIVMLIKRRLRNTDPVKLAAAQKNDNRAVLILYRSMLTLLSQLGYAPINGETPEAFADRVCRSGLSNLDFLEFSREVIRTRYSRTPAERELTALGARAYVRFRHQMKRSERIRFDIHRVLHGLGDFDAIP